MSQESGRVERTWLLEHAFLDLDRQDPLLVQDGEPALGVRQAADETKRVAENLLDLGLQPGDVVSVPVGPEAWRQALVGYFASQRASGVPFMVDPGRARLGPAPAFELTGWPLQASPVRPETGSPYPLAADILLTSGTTGQPLVIALPAAALWGPGLTWERAQGGLLLNTFPPWSAAGVHGAVPIAISSQMTLACATRFDPYEFCRTARRLKPSLVFTGPHVLKQLLDLPPSLVAQALGSVSHVLTTGAPLASPHGEAFSDLLPDVVLVDSYATTQTGHAQILAIYKGGHQLSSGIPSSRTGFQVRDPAGGLQEDGRPGELWLRSEGDGLHDKPGPWTATGDIAYSREGRVRIVGRADSQVNIAGQKIDPSVARDALQALSEVADVHVSGVQDAELGQHLFALIVAAGQHALSSAMIERVVAQSLGRWVPLRCLWVDQLPYDDLGKVPTWRVDQLAATSIARQPGA